jgi:S1-C subfamily serine protease
MLLSGCASAPTRSAATALSIRAHPAIPDPLVDATLRAMIEDRGGALSAQGGLRSSDVAEQLKRSACRVSLKPVNTSILDLPEVYTQSVPGTLVLARIFLCDKCPHWHTRSAATAFAISADGVCVTNYHVFEHDDDGSTLVVADAWGNTHLVLEILAANKRNDIAIFRVSLDNGPLTPLPLLTDAPVGTSVAVISHPANHYFSLSPGVVSRRSGRLRGMNNDIKDPAPDESHREPGDAPARIITPTLEITADYGVGSSGGPVLDMRGNVLGMVSNTMPVYADPKDRRSLQMSFHHCVPSASILELITRD